MLQPSIAVVVMSLGVFFMLVAAIGFIRLPDVFCRLHTTGIIDTLGAPLILLGVAIYLGPTLAAGKLILALVFIALTSPLVGHLLARAALEEDYRPEVISDSERQRVSRERQQGEQTPEDEA